MPETPTPTPAPDQKLVPFHKRHKRALIIALVLCVIIVAAAALLFKTEAMAALHWAGQFLSDLVDTVRKAGPVPYFLAYAILPAVGVPVSLFNLTVAPAFAPTLGIGWVIVLSALCLSIDMAFSYWLARYALRPLIEKLVKRLGYSLPDIPKDEHVTACVILRVLPGPPHAVQSFILGLAKVHFLPYMIVSFIGQFGWSLAMILLGKSFTQGGSFKIAFLAIVLIIFLVIATRLVRKYYMKKGVIKNANAGTPGSHA